MVNLRNKMKFQGDYSETDTGEDHLYQKVYYIFYVAYQNFRFRGENMRNII